MRFLIIGRFNGGNYDNNIAYLRYLDLSGNILAESNSVSGINNISKVITVPEKCVKIIFTVEYSLYHRIITYNSSVFNYIEKIPDYVQGLANSKSRVLVAKETKTGVYFKYEKNIRSDATSYIMHVYNVIPGEKLHVLTRYSSGSEANSTDALRFYNHDKTIFGEILNAAAGGYTFDDVVEVPWYAETVEVISDGMTVNVTGDEKPYVAVENEVAIFIGDSYTQANSLVSAGYFKQRRFSTLISRYYGWKEVNYAVGGMGYIWGETTFIQQLENAIADTTYDHDKVEKVFVCGGRNDSQVPAEEFDDAAYLTAVKAVIDRANAAFPNADVVLIPMMWDSIIPPGIIYKQYGLICNAAYGKNAVIIPNAYQWLIGFKDYILNDNVHPNVEGHAIIFGHLINSLETGFSYPYLAIVKLNKVYTGLSESSYFDITQDNGQLRFQMLSQLSQDVANNTVLFNIEVTNTQNNPVLFTQWDISLFEISNNKDIGCFVISNAYTENGYIIQVKAHDIIKAGEYQEYNFSIPFGLQAYASNY